MVAGSGAFFPDLLLRHGVVVHSQLFQLALEVPTLPMYIIVDHQWLLAEIYRCEVAANGPWCAPFTLYFGTLCRIGNSDVAPCVRNKIECGGNAIAQGAVGEHQVGVGRIAPECETYPQPVRGTSQKRSARSFSEVLLVLPTSLP